MSDGSTVRDSQRILERLGLGGGCLRPFCHDNAMGLIG